jgi:hypothetical protein
MKIPVKLLKIAIIGICVLIVVFSYILCRMEPQLKLGFKFRDLIPYQCWLTGIVIFCLILPAKVGTVFDD